MNENSINSNIETGAEEVITPVYTSKSIMDKELFYDFCSVGYNRTKKVFLTFLCVLAFQIVVNILVGNYNTVVVLGPFISFCMTLIYFRIQKGVKISYERNLIASGKESTLNQELFEDKIVSNVDEMKREYFYHQITKFFETKNFLLLHLQHNLHITINKNNLNSNIDEVKSFLIEKSTHVKKKKFVNCSNDKKWCLRFLIATISITIIGAVVGLAIPLIHNKPIHFKELDYSTTRSDVHKFYGQPDEIREFIYPKGEFYDVYESEFLGVKGELEFEYFDDGEELFTAQFIIDSNDFETYKDYEKAVRKTYKYFDKVLSRYQKWDTSDEDGIDISWARNIHKYAYSMYNTQTSDTGFTDDLRDCTVFQFNKYPSEDQLK